MTCHDLIPVDFSSYGSQFAIPHPRPGQTSPRSVPPKFYVVSLWSWGLQARLFPVSRKPIFSPCSSFTLFVQLQLLLLLLSACTPLSMRPLTDSSLSTLCFSCNSTHVIMEVIHAKMSPLLKINSVGIRLCLIPSWGILQQFNTFLTGGT